MQYNLKRKIIIAIPMSFETENGKTIKQLTRALKNNLSAKKQLWHGFLFGIGRTVGTILVWAIVLTVVLNILQSLGILDRITENFGTFGGIMNAF